MLAATAAYQCALPAQMSILPAQPSIDMGAAKIRERAHKSTTRLLAQYRSRYNVLNLLVPSCPPCSTLLSVGLKGSQKDPTPAIAGHLPISRIATVECNGADTCSAFPDILPFSIPTCTYAMSSSHPDISAALPNNTHPQWWKDPALRRLNALMLAVITVQMTCGYDEAVVGSFQAMQPWVDAMGNPDASHIGLVTTVIFIGGFLGAMPASWCSDRYGRKMGITVGSLCTMIGSIIQSSAYGYSQFMVGRGLLGVGISFTCVAGPSLLAELAHPRQRGTVLG